MIFLRFFLTFLPSFNLFLDFHFHIFFYTISLLFTQFFLSISVDYDHKILFFFHHSRSSHFIFIAITAYSCSIYEMRYGQWDLNTIKLKDEKYWWVIDTVTMREMFIEVHVVGRIEGYGNHGVCACWKMRGRRMTGSDMIQHELSWKSWEYSDEIV